MAIYELDPVAFGEFCDKNEKDEMKYFNIILRSEYKVKDSKSREKVLLLQSLNDDTRSFSFTIGIGDHAKTKATCKVRNLPGEIKFGPKSKASFVNEDCIKIAVEKKDADKTWGSLSLIPHE